MCFDRFVLAVESRDLSQADKSVFFFNFTKLAFLNDKTYSYTKKKLFSKAQFGKIDVFVHFINQKFER